VRAAVPSVIAHWIAPKGKPSARFDRASTRQRLLRKCNLRSERRHDGVRFCWTLGASLAGNVRPTTLCLVVVVRHLNADVETEACPARSPRATPPIDLRMNGITRTFRKWSWPIADKAVRLLHPQAHAFYMKLMEDGYQPNVLIDVLPDERIVYVCVPKCASSRIKKTLSALLGRYVR
jgi:hypothetical protein